jgi:hypothetical protein
MAEILLGAAAASTAAGGAAAAFIPGVAAASSAAAAGGLSSTILSILSGTASVVGILGTLAGARSEQNAMEGQALETELQAGQEQLQSTNRQTALRHQLYQVLGENRVAAAASGIELGANGLAGAEERRQQQLATGDLTIERQDDEMRRAMLKARANGLRARGRDAMTAGLFRSFGQAASFGMDVMERG